MRRPVTLPKVPVAAGESWASDTEFDGARQAKAVDIVQPDATHCGGVSAAAGYCKAAGRVGQRAALHVWGSPVAFLANLHVAARLGSSLVQVDLLCAWDQRRHETRRDVPAYVTAVGTLVAGLVGGKDRVGP